MLRVRESYLSTHIDVIDPVEIRGQPLSGTAIAPERCESDHCAYSTAKVVRHDAMGAVLGLWPFTAEHEDLKPGEVLQSSSAAQTQPYNDGSA
ncbi:hypothetical protein CHU98_g6210 [Xylaria longipes]|nr:hypothetical protein CHU98_g6210 [Xylaria longipes]